MTLRTIQFLQVAALGIMLSAGMGASSAVMAFEAEPTPQTTPSYQLRGAMDEGDDAAPAVQSPLTLPSPALSTSQAAPIAQVQNLLEKADSFVQAPASRVAAAFGDIVNVYKTSKFGSLLYGLGFDSFPLGLGAKLEHEIGAFGNMIDTRIALSLSSAPSGLDSSLSGFALSNPNQNTSMVNYVVDWASGQFRPFVGAGVGLASGAANEQQTQARLVKDDVTAGWNVLAGASYTHSSLLSFEAGYRFLQLGSALPEQEKLAQNAGTPTTHEMFVGGKVQF